MKYHNEIIEQLINTTLNHTTKNYLQINFKQRTPESSGRASHKCHALSTLHRDQCSKFHLGDLKTVDVI